MNIVLHVMVTNHLLDSTFYFTMLTVYTFPLNTLMSTHSVTFPRHRFEARNVNSDSWLYHNHTRRVLNIISTQSVLLIISDARRHSSPRVQTTRVNDSLTRRR